MWLNIVYVIMYCWDSSLSQPLNIHIWALEVQIKLRDYSHSALVSIESTHATSEQGHKEFIHLSKEHSLSLDCFPCLVAVAVASALSWGIVALGAMVAAVVEKPNWCRYFLWDWKKTPWHVLANITHSVGYGRMTWIGISNIVTPLSLVTVGVWAREGRWPMPNGCWEENVNEHMLSLFWWFFDIG